MNFLCGATSSYHDWATMLNDVHTNVRPSECARVWVCVFFGVRLYSVYFALIGSKNQRLFTFTLKCIGIDALQSGSRSTVKIRNFWASESCRTGIQREKKRWPDFKFSVALFQESFFRTCDHFDLSHQQLDFTKAKRNIKFRLDVVYDSISAFCLLIAVSAFAVRTPYATDLKLIKGETSHRTRSRTGFGLSGLQLITIQSSSNQPIIHANWCDALSHHVNPLRSKVISTWFGVWSMNFPAYSELLVTALDEIQHRIGGHQFGDILCVTLVNYIFGAHVAFVGVAITYSVFINWSLPFENWIRHRERKGKSE